MKVIDSKSAKATPRAVNSAKLCNGSIGLVIMLMKPAIVVTPAIMTAGITSFRLPAIKSR